MLFFLYLQFSILLYRLIILYTIVLDHQSLILFISLHLSTNLPQFLLSFLLHLLHLLMLTLRLLHLHPVLLLVQGVRLKQVQFIPGCDHIHAIDGLHLLRLGGIYLHQLVEGTLGLLDTCLDC